MNACTGALLPTEVLGMIFSEIIYGILDPMDSLDSYPFYLDNSRYQVGAVCRYWRRCLLANRALWRVIDIKRYRYSLDKAPPILDRIVRCIQRSGMCPLDIWLKFDSSYGTDSGREQFYSIVDAITGQDGDGSVLRRWRRFVLDGRDLPNAPVQLLDHLSSCLASPAPELEVIEFQRCDMNLPDTSQHPKLTTLRLSRCAVTLTTSLQSLRSLYLEGHHTLNFGSSPLETESWFRLLDSTPLLTHLHLSQLGRCVSDMSQEPITLANLTHLEMDTPPRLYFLRHLHCPKLRRFTFHTGINPSCTRAIIQLLRQAPQFVGIPIIGFKSSWIQEDEILLLVLSQPTNLFAGLQEIWVGSTESAEWYAKYLGGSESVHGKLSIRSYEDPNAVFVCT
jgi:F-box-like